MWRYVTVWEEHDLRRIPDALLQSVVFLYPTLEAAVDGKGYGGSGFVVAMTRRELVDREAAASDPLIDPAHLYIVTNAHVAATCEYVRTSVAAQPIIHVENWTFHWEGDDVAIAHLGIAGVTPIGLGRPMHTSVLMTEAAFLEAQVGPGDQVFMVGRFTGLDERERHQPTVRAGILAMAEPIAIENRQWNGHKQESFFVEVNSKAGYSGSPVFVEIPIEIPPVTASIMYPPRRQYLGCLGMTWGLWGTYVPLLDPNTRERVPEGWVFHENSGIEMVIPAWRITRLLVEEGVAEQRNQFAEAARRKVKGLRSDAVATNARPDDEPPNFASDAFEDAIRNVSRR